MTAQGISINKSANFTASRHYIMKSFVAREPLQDVLLRNECQQLKNTDTLSGTSQVAVRADQREISPEKKTDGSVAWENDLEKASSETDRREAGR